MAYAVNPKLRPGKGQSFERLLEDPGEKRGNRIPTGPARVGPARSRFADITGRIGKDAGGRAVQSGFEQLFAPTPAHGRSAAAEAPYQAQRSGERAGYPVAGLDINAARTAAGAPPFTHTFTDPRLGMSFPSPGPVAGVDSTPIAAAGSAAPSAAAGFGAGLDPTLAGMTASEAALAGQGAASAAPAAGTSTQLLQQASPYLQAAAQLYGIASAAMSDREDWAKAVTAGAYALAPPVGAILSMIPTFGKRSLSRAERERLDIMKNAGKASAIPGNFMRATEGGGFQDIWKHLVSIGSGSTGGQTGAGYYNTMPATTLSMPLTAEHQAIWPQTSPASSLEPGETPDQGTPGGHASPYTGMNTFKDAFVGLQNPYYPVWKPEYFFQELYRNPKALDSTIWAGPGAHTFGTYEQNLKSALLKRMEELLTGGQSYMAPGTFSDIAWPSNPPAPEGPAGSDTPTSWYGDDPYGNAPPYDPNAGAGFRHGGRVPDRADIPGGAEPIMAHEGEMVMNPEATQQYGPMLERMNQMGPGMNSRDGMRHIKRMVLEFANEA